ENQENLLKEYFASQMARAARAETAAKVFAEGVIAAAQKGEKLQDAVDRLSKENVIDELQETALEDEERPALEISRAFTIEENPIPTAQSETSPAVLAFALEEDDSVHPQPIVTRTGFAVLQLKEKELLTREEFEKDADRIIAQLQSRKAEQVLEEHVAEAVSRLGTVIMNPKYIPDESAKDSSSNPAEKSEKSAGE
ncbi:MAG: hypothetical protein MK135_02635, partial [Polyangiaceae bacterium]|nr:hypothetical protein [Polyangiaceae bacterium]